MSERVHPTMYVIYIWYFFTGRERKNIFCNIWLWGISSRRNVLFYFILFFSTIISNFWYRSIPPHRVSDLDYSSSFYTIWYVLKVVYGNGGCCAFSCNHCWLVFFCIIAGVLAQDNHHSPIIELRPVVMPGDR